MDPISSGMLTQEIVRSEMVQEDVLSESLPRRMIELKDTSEGLLTEKLSAVIAGSASAFFRPVKEKVPLVFCVPVVKVPWGAPAFAIERRVALLV